MLPDYIRILYRTFRRVEVEPGVIQKASADIDDDTGLLRHELGPEAAIAERVAHEIKHEIFRQSGLGSIPELEKYEEAIVTAFSCGDLAVMRDNPGLYATLDRMIGQSDTSDKTAPTSGISDTHKD